MSTKLTELIAHTKKQLEHLRILGVEGIAAAPAPTRTYSSPVENISTSLFGDLAPAAQTLTKSNETFEAIHCEIGPCTRCPLHEQRTHVVHTEGNRKARL